MLLWVVYGLVGTIGLMLLAVFVRETWRARERRRFERLRAVCNRRLRVLKYLEPEDISARLRAEFPLSVIENSLEEFAEQSATSMREKLVQVNEDLGLVQSRIEALTDAGSWPERAAAAERLGRIGHSAAVLPLIATLQDQSEDKQVKSVGLDDEWFYAAQATGASGFATPAAIERLSLASSGVLLENNDRFDLTSFAATGVLPLGTEVYVTTGDNGHVYALDVSDMSTVGQYALDDARWVAHDADNGRIVVVQGTPGRISVFQEGDFPGGSMTLLTTFPFPGALVPESKSTVEVVGGKAFIAAGPEGVQVMCLDDGKIVGSVPRPDPFALGLDPSVVVTNAVTVDEDLMFISNGEAGVYIAAGAAEFASTPCNAPQNITMLGHLRFDALQSVNHVDYENKRLLIAAGLGGLKIVRVNVTN